MRNLANLRDNVWELVPRPINNNVIGILLAIACCLKIKLFLTDVKSAFLNVYLNEEAYVEQPKIFEDSHYTHHVYKLKKALYGLKQAS